MSDTEQQSPQNQASQEVDNAGKNFDGITVADLKAADLRLDNGSVLEDVTLSYRTFGTHRKHAAQHKICKK